ncbi:MAG TPA: hypothetical protein VFW71_10500 [Actinomycetota bacterium]|nr:hypothetical protein [Actinomycetota bacterium]
MARTLKVAPDEIRYRVAHRLSDYEVRKGGGEIGTLAIGLKRGLVRTFKAHWTGFKVAFPQSTLFLSTSLTTGEYWSEAYISIHQPSWVFAFRKDPHKARGSGGPRPEDKLSAEAAVDTALAYRHGLVASGHVAHEELIRMEDFDDPLEAVDEFFNYTTWYVLRAIDATWAQLGYTPDGTIGWGAEEDRLASLPRGHAPEALRRPAPRPEPPRVVPPVPDPPPAPAPVAVPIPVIAPAVTPAPVSATPSPRPAPPAPPAAQPPPKRALSGPAEEVRFRLAGRLADYRVSKGPGELGTLHIGLERHIVRAFKAHWTGFKLTFPKSTMFLTAAVNSGEYWSEAYVSIHQPSWVLAFRKDPHKARGSGGPRPEDKLSAETAVDIAHTHRRGLIDAGRIAHEELIRMEDFDDPLEAVDEFFNYTTWYVLRAIDASWSQLGYQPDPSIFWGPDEEAAASAPPLRGLVEGLEASETIWITPEDGVTIPTRQFVYRPGHIFVLSADQNKIANARDMRTAQVALRWKGRDARLVDFPATVRVIGPENRVEFGEVARLILEERYPARAHGPAGEETLRRWFEDGVILEFTPPPPSV